VTTLPGEPSIA